MQGEGLRDHAPNFAAAGCTVAGISFDTPADNAAFRTSSNFPFDLLSDPDQTIGATYDVLRDADDPFADYPKRISYLIDPDGVVAKVYEVDDPAGHASEVLADLAALQS
mgnify:CR=1 FL=1